MLCAKVSILVNGSVGEEFRMEKGLKWGYSLSSLPFNLVVELLPTLVV